MTWLKKNKEALIVGVIWTLLITLLILNPFDKGGLLW